MVSKITLDKYVQYNESGAEYLCSILDSIVDQPIGSEEESIALEFDLENIPVMDLYTANSIYYAAGYLVKSIMKNHKMCCERNCLQNHVSETALYEDYSRLTIARDFTGNSLVYLKRTMFGFFQNMASLFLIDLANLLNIRKNTKLHLLSLFETIEMNEICFSLKITIIKRFAIFCIRLTNEKRVRPIKDFSSPSMFSMV